MSGGMGTVVILLGPPGVGKGTQGLLLAEGSDLLHLSTGDLLRKHRKEQTDLGRQAQAYMDRGELVPDHLILDMVRTVLATSSDRQGVIFDGFPRTVAQAAALDEVLHTQEGRVGVVVVLKAEDEVIVSRLAARRTCPSCGAVYNVNSNPPGVEGHCDRCGETLVHRGDDYPDTVRRRLDVYREETEPIVNYYDESGSSVSFVDGDREVLVVQANIRDAVAAVSGAIRSSLET